MSNLYHLQINIKDPKVSIPFYKGLFSFLKFKVIEEGEDHIGFSDGISNLWLIGTEDKYKDNLFHRKNTGLNHLAFKVDSKEEVDNFHNNFLIKNNISTLYDSPKIFPEYHKDYYVVYFEDPDRIKLEVVYRSFESRLSEDYQKWHKKKEIIDSKEIIPDFSQQDIWWCSLGLNVGFEEDGKHDDFERPVLIIKKFSRDVFIGLPITSTLKDSPYYFKYDLHGQPGSIILSHPRLLSSKRLNRRLSKMGRGTFKTVMENYLKLFT